MLFDLERLMVPNKHRTLHGALLDSELLAEMYLGMTRGQGSFDIGSSTEDDEGGAVADAGGGRWPPTGLRVRLATDAERQLIGVKECTSLANMAYLIEHRPEEFLIYTGEDGDAFHAINLGADGVISVASHTNGCAVLGIADCPGYRHSLGELIHLLPQCLSFIPL